MERDPNIRPWKALPKERIARSGEPNVKPFQVIYTWFLVIHAARQFLGSEIVTLASFFTTVIHECSLHQLYRSVEYFICCLICTAPTHGCIHSSLSRRCNREEAIVQSLTPILWRKAPYRQFYSDILVPRVGRFINARANSGVCAAESSAGLLYPTYYQLNSSVIYLPESMQFENKHLEKYFRLHQPGNCHTIFHNLYHISCCSHTTAIHHSAHSSSLKVSQAILMKVHLESSP